MAKGLLGNLIQFHGFKPHLCLYFCFKPWPLTWTSAIQLSTCHPNWCLKIYQIYTFGSLNNLNMIQTHFLIPFTSIFPLCGWHYHPLSCSTLKPSNHPRILSLPRSFHRKNLPNLSNDLLWIHLFPSSSIASTLVPTLSSLTRLLH